MRKHYTSGLIGLDIKHNHSRRIKPNRYKFQPLRRWVMPALFAIFLIFLAVLVKVSS